MNCKEFENIIDRYLDCELTDVEAREVQEHLDKCPTCRKEFGPLIEFLNSSWEVKEKVPDGLRSRIFNILARQEAFPSRQKRNHWWVWSAAAAAIVLITFGWWVRPVPPKQVAAAPENPPARINPWIVSSLVQSFAVSGSANPVLSLVQADAMEQWFKETCDTPVLPAQVRYTLYMPEPAKPTVEVPILEFAIFSTIQKL
jgi:hypothetical protein